MRKRLLFVCVENSCRSQMAEGFARALGGDAVEALSAGSRPSGVVNPEALRSMADVGIDLARQRSRGVAEVARGRFDAVVTMGCGDACPAVPAGRREDWALPDPKALRGQAFDRVRDTIRARVAELLWSLGVPTQEEAREGS